MKKSQLSLKWLDVFRQVARAGSVQGAAGPLGLSVSTVSHHLKALETALGVPLFDHAHRPLRLTARGAMFLSQVDEAMQILHQAEADLHAHDLSGTRSLSIAMIEDFDSEIAPELARQLSQSMPDCAFRHLTRPSHAILDLLRAGEVDIGVAAKPQFAQPDLIEHPLLRDPYVLAVPAATDVNAEACLAGNTALPFLRYSPEQVMGRQITAQLKRLKIPLPASHEFESNETIMSMVAGGAGWAITTPTNYARSTRFQHHVQMLPFPAKGFARYLSVFTTEAQPSPLCAPVVHMLRQLIQSRAIAPVLSRMGWLHQSFRLLDDPASHPPRETDS